MNAAAPRDRLEQAARTEAERTRRGAEDPEPSLGARLGQIGILGWMVVVPALLGLFLGRWLDHRFSTGIFFSAPLLLVGAGVGFWSAWKWMHRNL
ncbi:AtpZ/AtpI family protein [Pseudorhodoferax sp.]|uniref:AtpZ/AtpI family protein n=1 Tax=Pseudorhodoferax sp. TaxID=1993553 RepID=UPI0039E270FB